VQSCRMNRPGSKWQTYDREFFSKIAKIEDRHFWFSARRHIIKAALEAIVQKLPSGYRVLELGCGTGGALCELTRACGDGEVIGMDLYPEAAAFARARAACQVIVGDILNPPDLGKFHVVAMFDVLEHLPNDREVLLSVNRMLHDDGALMLTVPAHMTLWSYFDVAARHCRRYERGNLVELLTVTGFQTEYVTEFMLGTFPLLWLKRRMARGAMADQRRVIEKASEELKIVPFVNELLKLILAWEPFAIGHRWQLPVGSSLLAVARRRVGEFSCDSSKHHKSSKSPGG
jgi:SAM-dependent methyltransferase